MVRERSLRPWPGTKDGDSGVSRTQALGLCFDNERARPSSTTGDAVAQSLESLDRSWRPAQIRKLAAVPMTR